MLNPRRIQRRLLRITLLLSALGVGYLFWRYDSLTLPEGMCSPLDEFGSGQTLVLDMHPTHMGPGDSIFFEHGGWTLGRILRVQGEQLWIEIDDGDCGPYRPERDGPILRSACRARILMVWPGGL